MVVLEFWATWCAPCIGEIPVLSKLQADSDTPADGSEPDTHVMQQGPSDVDITNASPMNLLASGAGIPRTRIDFDATLPKTIYNLHVHLKGADAHDRMEAVLVAWKSATGLQFNAALSQYNPLC